VFDCRLRRGRPAWASSRSQGRARAQTARPQVWHRAWTGVGPPSVPWPACGVVREMGEGVTLRPSQAYDLLSEAPASAQRAERRSKRSCETSRWARPFPRTGCVLRRVNKLTPSDVEPTSVNGHEHGRRAYGFRDRSPHQSTCTVLLVRPYAPPCAAVSDQFAPAQ
jgi:hypothetical protein